MYPKLYLDAFRSFERTPEVFVAMPFASQFENRWRKLFRPAIISCQLKPFRIKENIVGDSIPVDILKGIGRAKLILADISDEFDRNERTAPNPNVMYELGIAHTARLPEEVIVLRDKESKVAPFDIRHIRWNEFSEKNVKKAHDKIKKLIKLAEKEIDVIKDLMVERTMEAMDSDLFSFLDTVRSQVDTGFDLYPFDPDRKGLYGLPDRECSEEYLRNLARKLIEVGVLKSREAVPLWQKIYGGTPEYGFTELGRAILTKIPRIDKKPSARERERYFKQLTTQSS